MRLNKNQAVWQQEYSISHSVVCALLRNNNLLNQLHIKSPFVRMNIKKLKTGSLSLLFNLEGTDYTMKLCKEDGSLEDNDDSGKDENQEGVVKETVYKYQVELKAGHRNIVIEKVVDGDNDPQYKVKGCGMEKEEMVTFGQNWVAMVQGNLDMETMGLEPFFHMFNHFFGERLEALMVEMESEEEMEGEEEMEEAKGVNGDV